VVISKNKTRLVTDIDGKRQLFEEPPGQFEGLFVVTQTNDATGFFCDNLK
jgi:hypothetical protein